MKKIFGISLAATVLWMAPLDVLAATQCSAIDTNAVYVCIEDRHSQVLPGQEEWWWFVDPQKGQFSPVVGAEDLGYTKQYTCQDATKYDATISVAYPFPYPNFAYTSDGVTCDRTVTAQNDEEEDWECEDCEENDWIADEFEPDPWEWEEDFWEWEEEL